MYSPQIPPYYVTRLYLLKIAYARLGICKPMTAIVRQALDDYIPKAVKEILRSDPNLHIPDELTKR